mgnify:CR=1 FL=1
MSNRVLMRVREVRDYASKRRRFGLIHRSFWADQGLINNEYQEYQELVSRADSYKSYGV